VKATDLPTDIISLTSDEEESGDPTGVADAFAAGIAAIANASSINHVYRATHALAIRLPRVRSAAMLHRDDSGFLALVYNPQGRVLPERATKAASELHRQWISAHAPDGVGRGIRPVIADRHSGLTIVPFVRGDSLLGAVLLESEGDQPTDATPAVNVSLGAIGVVVSQALANLVLRHRLKSTVSADEHQAALSMQAKVLGRKLHDGPAQLLAILSMDLDRQIKLLRPGEQAEVEARQARDLLDRAIDSMRQCIVAMRQGAVTQAAPSMTGPLRALVAEMDPEAASLEVEFKGVSGVQLTPEVEQALVGITREALHNVRKHAQAETVRLEVHRIGPAVELVVHDDGIGFDGSSPPGHFGLEQIRELAHETGGRVEIASSVGQGTEVRVRIPMPQVVPETAPESAPRDIT
jgi:signal transduction histidine kinase